MNSRGYLKYDWPRATLLFGGGYTTAKSPLVENIIHGCQHGDTFLGGSSS